MPATLLELFYVPLSESLDGWDCYIGLFLGTVSDTSIHHEKTEQLSCSIHVAMPIIILFRKYGILIDVGEAYSQAWGKYPQNRPAVWTVM